MVSNCLSVVQKNTNSQSTHVLFIFVHTMDNNIIGLLPYTSDKAPRIGDETNCSNENRDPINPRIY